VGVAECMWTEHLNSAAIGKVCVRCQGQNGIREIRPSGIAGGPGETWPWLNWEPTPQPKGRGWKPSATSARPSSIPTVLFHHQRVRRLEIAMDQTLMMRVLDC